MTILTRLREYLTMPRRGRLVFAHDLVMAALSFVIAMLLRVGEDVFLYFDPPTLVLATLVFTAIAGTTFLLTNLYRGIWRYASMPDMIAVARAATLTILIFLLVLFTWTRLEPLPRSVPFINGLVLIALLAGPRILYRIRKDRRMDRRLEAEAGRKIPVLLAGSGAEAELFIRGLRNEPQRVYAIVGILAGKAKRVGQQIHGVPILGTIDQLAEVVATLKERGRHVERVILTQERTDGAQVRRLFDRATALGLTLARLPRLTDFRSGAPDAVPARVDVRPIAVEDLLGRPQMPLDPAPAAASVRSWSARSRPARRSSWFCSNSRNSTCTRSRRKCAAAIPACPAHRSSPMCAIEAGSCACSPATGRRSCFTRRR